MYNSIRRSPENKREPKRSQSHLARAMKQQNSPVTLLGYFGTWVPIFTTAFSGGLLAT